MSVPARFLRLVVLGLVGVVLLLCFAPWPTALQAFTPSFARIGASSTRVREAKQLYETRRSERIADYNPAADEKEFRFRGLSTSLPEYVDRLRTFVYEAFPVHLQPPLLASIARLEQQLPPDPHRPPLSKKIYTTNKDKDDLPPNFDTWGKLHPDWQVDVLDDEGMDAWMDAYFGTDETDVTSMGAVWRGLPKIVLKSDTLRYLIMLLEGGVYSDSDTVPVAPAEEWGHDYVTDHLVDPELSLFGNLYNELHPILDPSISGVIAIEVDITISKKPASVRKWYARLIQFTQWTLMSKPFHPIYLDVLETIYRKAQKTEAALASGTLTHDKIERTLDFTGPGPYTDAILRYFLVHLALKPRDLVNLEGAHRVGDIIVLRQWAFSQSSEAGHSSPWGCVHHDFAGRWRHDN